MELNNIELKDDEYVKDNLIYCKVCNTPRSLYIKNNLRRCLCDCLTTKRDDDYKQMAETERLHNLEKLKINSLIGERYKDVNFKNTMTGNNTSFDIAYTRCKKYCEVSKTVLDKGMGIYIYGDTGTGKTHLTACMANTLLNQGYSVLFTNFFEISKSIKSTFGKSELSENDYINNLANIDFLFIDDLGTERVQSGESDLWMQEKIFDVLNRRYNNRKPTVFTSNHSINELVNERGFMKKTVDRIIEMSVAILKIEGDSYRKKNRKNVDVPF